MNFKNLLKSVLRDLGLKVVKLNSPFITKHDPFLVQKEMFNGLNLNPIIFDVGAYHGHVALRYKSLFPNSTIYCFEPFCESFKHLQANLSNQSSFKLFQLGLSDSSGKSFFHSNQFEMTNSILESDIKGNLTWGEGLLETKEVVEIETKTIDELVLELGIESIDILKMDVQGAEFKVIRGAKDFLANGGVKIVYTEIITMPTYIGQMGLEDTLMLFKNVGFQLVGLYNYSYSSPGQLRQVDAIFIRK